MQLIGFNFTNVHAERQIIPKNIGNINTDIEFIDVEKEKVEIIKEGEPLKFTFRFSVMYHESKDKKEEPIAEIYLKGHLVMLADKNEAKEIFKSWKKKELPALVRAGLSNILLRRCSSKALLLEEEINLPSHLPIPQLQLQPKQE